MALPGVTIQIQNGALGQVLPTDDAVCGLLLQSDVAPSGLALLTAKQLFSLAEAEAIGITAAFDTTNTCRVYKHLKEFYDEAGTGAECWILITSKAVTMQQLVATNQPNYAVKLLDAANGRIRLLGATRSPAAGYTAVTTGWGVDSDAGLALTVADTLATDYSTAFKPLRVVIEALYFTGTPGDLKDLRTLTDNRAAMLLGDTVTGNGSAVGLLMGRLANIPVQRNVGRVKDGALTALAAWLKVTKLEDAGSQPTAIHDKGFITLRRYVGKAGYYFSDDPTAAPATDDYNSLARGRIIDKAIVLAYGVFINEILDEVEVDAQGRIDPAKTAYYQAIIENAVNNAMTANGEISAFSAFCDPNQNVLSTGKVCVDARIRPLGYAKDITVKLGFENPAIS